MRPGDANRLPRGAVSPRTHGCCSACSAVYRVRGESVALTEVDVGRRDGLRAQILEGVSEGDQVVVHPSDQVVDGVSVRVR